MEKRLPGSGEVLFLFKLGARSFDEVESRQETLEAELSTFKAADCIETLQQNQLLRLELSHCDACTISYAKLCYISARSGDHIHVKEGHCQVLSRYA